MSRRWVVAASVVVLGLLTALASWHIGGSDQPTRPGPPVIVQNGALYVSPTGSDTADGSRDHPLATIQAALDRAGPGTVITLGEGEYREKVATVRDGNRDAPITIKGPETGQQRSGRYQAVLFVTGRGVSIDHSYIILDGFTIDGQEKLVGTTFPTSAGAMDAFKDRVKASVVNDKLIYVGASDSARDLTGITINNMFLNASGTECVRIRNNSRANTISNSVIQYCGLFGKQTGVARAVYHNGEGVYIGTSPKSTSQPMHRNDSSSHNLIIGNVIRTFGSECFDVKENAHDNEFIGNRCSANTESSAFSGSNVELRGYRNVVRGNLISNSAGANIKIGADKGGYRNGGNIVRDNRLSGSARALQLKSKDTQGSMCGNTVAEDQVLTLHGNAGPAKDVTGPC